MTRARDVLVPPARVTDGVRFEPPVKKRKGPPPWALQLMRRRSLRSLRKLITLIAAVLCIALIVGVAGVRIARGSAGTVGVVRNGGPLDKRTIRQIIMPGQGLTYTGLFSQTPHIYPAAHVTLKYTVTSAATRTPRPATDTIVLPTRDGVQVGVDAAVFFRFVGDSDVELLEQFDKSYGTRRYATPKNRQVYPWQSDAAFDAMLDSLFRPVLENDLRKEIGNFPCASLVSSCALVQSGAADSGTGKPGTTTSPTASIAGIEKRVAASLQRDLATALGDRYFLNIRFRVGRVTLPANVQNAVDEAQMQFTEVNTARAQLEQARYQAKSKRLLGDQYNRSTGLTTIDALKALPSGANVIISTGGNTPPMILAPNGTGGAPTSAGGADQTTDGADPSDSPKNTPSATPDN
jgi:regulator of protease activity HflC (stomatin/prohibitin superfamily)